MGLGPNGRWCVVLVFAVPLSGCAPEDFTEQGTISERSATILRGTEARDRPEACVVETSSGLCSGTLVAPNVVLTAGHCVAGSERWWVSCPYSNDTATVTASQSAITPNYPNRDDPNRETIDNNQGSDLGLIRLDRALRETRVARVSFARVTVNSRVHAIGRVNNGNVTSARLFRSPTFALTSVDRRNGYWAGVDQTVIEGGDSGGGLFDNTSGQLIGVNSAGIDAQYCRRGWSCDEWALVSASTNWFRSNLQRLTEGASEAPAPTDPCASSTTCSTCTARAQCGWCDGRCQTGTASGPSGTTCGATWAWLSRQCT